VNVIKDILNPELKTLEWWISGLMLDLLFLIILQDYLKNVAANQRKAVNQ